MFEVLEGLAVEELRGLLVEFSEHGPTPLLPSGFSFLRFLLDKRLKNTRGCVNE